jgi:periplasmic protein TonB
MFVRILLSNNCFMEANKILQADVLDIIFDGRNKEYGAYELRSNYKKRLFLSVGSMLLTCFLLLLLYSIANGRGNERVVDVFIPDSQLEEIKPKEEEPPPIEQPKPKPQQQVEMRQYTKPIITHEEVKPDEKPPEMDELEDTRIGKINQEGDKDNGIIAPPVDDGDKGVIVEPKKDEEDWDKTFVSVQIESEYPGGMKAWTRYLQKTLPNYYNGDIIEQGIQGRVVMQFVVDKEGNVSDVRGIEGPKELWAIAEKVIMKSGKWTPAIQNGRQVKSYKRQPLIFTLQEE